ncbi:thiamine pyrophosphate-dependent enzyme [Sporomusa acidovorans]|uniref:NADH-dependent phenylglyoxylate dehydrogenase subunit beta n=1 Tax=Sporomusa acidovorans (strain ATCC 49682 / DSM 3132 / Mol) TaxID=1123286 RepID=A0ABZ3J7L8_SPOA4|nr:thiamine pyrophosphate-dependent enzyme [Sporomusa acidovorans]OZC16661.1 NADH-dependent phenylglyoxylate dehydrogenase subunit beta [Sporomusa acidovorans DSM 3132]SDE07067.1 pyruvate ferredoxin oxidoreductase beta subunit [Sporomusa acidovorans]
MLVMKSEARGLIAHGVSACAGCGLELAARIIFDVMGANSVVVIPPGCAALFSGYGRETVTKIPGFQGNLESTAAYAAGIKAGFEMQGRGDVQVFGLAGDGATVDIGLQSLSGALERRDKILYICYDNEAYMNTGIQGSGSTPLAAWTTTTPGGKGVYRKDMVGIVAAHKIPYAATASVGYVDDLRKKMEKAKAATATGPAYIHVHAPCPTGWGSKPEHTVEVAKMAVQSLCWPLYEIVNGVEYTVTVPVSKPKPVTEYLKLQKRFSGAAASQVEKLQAMVTGDYEQLLNR